jgi:hypothetical protein
MSGGYGIPLVGTRWRTRMLARLARKPQIGSGAFRKWSRKTARGLKMPDMTDDERTVLMIADQGESMMPLGRWEQPVEHLVELGFLERHDKFNNTITSAGRKAIGKANDEVDDTFAKALIARHNASVVYRQKGEALAKELAEMARLASVTGDTPLTALNRCVAAVRDRAIELMVPPVGDKLIDDQRG